MFNVPPPAPVVHSIPAPVRVQIGAEIRTSYQAAPAVVRLEQTIVQFVIDHALVYGFADALSAARGFNEPDSDGWLAKQSAEFRAVDDFTRTLWTQIPYVVTMTPTDDLTEALYAAAFKTVSWERIAEAVAQQLTPDRIAALRVEEAEFAEAVAAEEYFESLDVASPIDDFADVTDLDGIDPVSL